VCFNVDKQFARDFTFPMPRGDGEYIVKFMEAAFDPKACYGEFFIEFTTCIQDTKLVERFMELGAGQVFSYTFGKDQGISASDALRRVQNLKTKTGVGEKRGSCSKQMQDRLEDKEQPCVMTDKEFDEKTVEQLKFSLKNLGDDMQTIQTSVQSQGAVVVGIKDDVVEIQENVKSQAADMVDIKENVKCQAVDMVEIKNGVCSVIPDYQRENALLKEALVKKTAACDSIEGRLAHKTTIVNRQTAFIAKLETDMQTIETEKQAWLREKANLIRENATLKEQLDLTNLLKRTLEKTQYASDVLASTTEALTTTVDNLSSTFEEERAAKRARI